MKKILYVTNITRPVNTFLIPHLNMLVKNGYEVHCACRIIGEHKLKTSQINNKIKFHHVSFTRNPIDTDNLKAYKQILKLNKENKYDIVHVHTPIAAFITRLALRKYSLKVIYTAHGFHFFNGASILNWLMYYPLEKVAARWTDVLITMNDEDFERSKKFRLRNESKTCLNKKIYRIDGIGVDLKEFNISNYDKCEFKKSLGLEKDDFVISVIGDLIKRKNHHQILKAISQLSNEYNYKDIKVIFAGDGILRKKIEKYIDEENLKEKVILLGYRNDINKIIGISDVVGLFSLHEGLPKNLLEAMANGKAIICTDIRGNNDLIKNNENGLLFKVNDIEETKNCIKKLYLDRNMIDKLGKENKKKISKYRIENVLSQMENIYKNSI